MQYIALQFIIFGHQKLKFPTYTINVKGTKTKKKTTKPRNIF